MVHKNVKLGENIVIQEGVNLGLPSRTFIMTDESEWPKTIIGDNAVLRSGTVIYCDVIIGSDFQTGHNVMIRENIKIGNKVSIGTNSVIDNATTLGSHINIQSMVYLPTNTIIEDLVFIGPNAVFTNDKYPVRINAKLVGPTIRKSATIGAGATVLPGIVIGEGAIVAAGSVVTRAVPAWTLAIGAPARIKELPKNLKKTNMI
jgi:acetyltransferase-like isoleucine patch superfamily enzyme